MSRTFTLVGRSSVLEAEIVPEIDLDKKYGIALVGLYTYNSIPNIEEKINNKFYYIDNGNRRWVTIPEGAYEIGDIEKALQDSIAANEVNKDLTISLKPNNNTLKCMLKSKYDVDFTPKDSVGPLLGFSQRKLEAGILHHSDRPVDIVRVNLIRVECNLVFDSYLNSKQTHILYEFKPTVDPGYAIAVTPSHLIYLAVQENIGSIRHINIRLTDQHSNEINLRGEEIIVRLELKPI